MAYYNPRPISFAPNASIIKSAGAIGDFFQNYSLQKQAEAEKEQARQFELDKFAWQKQRAGVQDEQWQDNFDAQQQQNEIANAYRDTTLGHTLSQAELAETWKQKEWKQKQDEIELLREQATKEKAEADALAMIEGIYKLNKMPELATQFGETTQEFGTPTQVETPHPLSGNPLIDKILGQPNFLKPQGYSLSNIEEKTTIDPATIRMIGKSDIKPDSTAKSEFITLTNMLDDPTLTPQKREWVNDRITKLTQPDMNSEQISWNNLQKAQQELAQTLKLPNQYSLATVDVTKLPPELQAQASAIGQRTINILKSKNPALEKSIGDLEAQFVQMNHSLGALETVGDIRFVDETVKKYFSNYFGLSEKEMQSTEATLALQSASNMMIRIDSGATVTNNELERAIAASMTPYQHKDKILKGMQNMARRNMATLDGFKRSIDPVAFNLKYGAIRKNYETLYNTIDNMQDIKQNGGTWQEVGATPSTQSTQIIEVSSEQEALQAIMNKGYTLEEAKELLPKVMK